ncbi:hypothetical protein Ga0100230_015920 [Opitutaceae bacterium TAV3]|nr:hypothetical protein Ga0100230_015920 [Opitutaceae bacterium TAV3]
MLARCFCCSQSRYATAAAIADPADLEPESQTPISRIRPLPPPPPPPPPSLPTTLQASCTFQCSPAYTSPSPASA